MIHAPFSRLPALTLAGSLLFALAAAAPEDELLELLRKDQPYTMVPASLFDRLGWDLPDGGNAVKKLAQAASGGAFDPKELESLPQEKIGYRAQWHVIRYPYYGLEWDITGLYLKPRNPLPGLPTVVYVHGGLANFYEFFVDPYNNPGLGQYLAQKIPVLLISIPGNYKPGGWNEPPATRKPAYLLDRELSGEEVGLRNSIFTRALMAEGVWRLIETATQGPVLLSGHSNGGEIQFMSDRRLKDRLRGMSLGWGTGGPASLRRNWEDEAARESNRSGERPYVAVTEVGGREPEMYTNGYVGPLNPISGKTKLEVAQKWFELEGRRRPQFIQPILGVEHSGRTDLRENVQKTIREAVLKSGLQIDTQAVFADLLATMKSPISGYQRMIWTTAVLDDGHWDPDPKKARELYVADGFREQNPLAQIRVAVYDVPMTHYGHIERPKQLAGGTLAAVKWLYE
ncbi:MAG: hypothetical protein HY315_07590 [Acidobacteria bacterium]|nr:hypothetical protein [Acidobacteriota bacterium]